jgi:hypothetical protein
MKTAGQKAAETRKANAAARVARAAAAKVASDKAIATKRASGHRYETGYMQSMAWALNQFVGAPAANGGTNGEIIERVMGASIAKPSALDTVDPAIFDAVSSRHDARCRTFREAFAACCATSSPTGHRYWQDLDLRTLQDCHPDFRALRLPEWVEQLIVEQELADHYAAMAEAAGGDLDDVSDVARDAAGATEETIPF